MIYITALKEVKRSTEDAYTGLGPPSYVGVLFIASAAHGEFQKCIPLVINAILALTDTSRTDLWN